MAKPISDDDCSKPKAASSLLPLPVPSAASPDALPPDMEGWLTTEQAAEQMGMEVRRFRDYSVDNRLSKRKLKMRVYYAPEVIQAAAIERAARIAEKSAALSATEPAGMDARRATPVDKPALLRQALAAIQAQTASIDRIVQNIGRMG